MSHSQLNDIGAGTIGSILYSYTAYCHMFLLRKIVFMVVLFFFLLHHGSNLDIPINHTNGSPRGNNFKYMTLKYVLVMRAVKISCDIVLGGASQCKYVVLLV